MTNAKILGRKALGRKRSGHSTQFIGHARKIIFFCVAVAITIAVGRLDHVADKTSLDSLKDDAAYESLFFSYITRLE